jgi:hypothetical protein
VAAQAQTFSAEDLAHRTIEVGIWGMPAVRLGGGKESWPPIFYLPIWKDPLTYLEGPLDREPSCSLSVKYVRRRCIPPLLPCAEGMQVFPSQDPQPLGSKRAAPNPVGGRPILSEGHTPL